MATITELMLELRDGRDLWYHKDTGGFSTFPLSEPQRKEILEHWELYQDMQVGEDTNNVRLYSEEVDHKDIMRFYVRECVEDKAIRKQLFSILRRYDFVDAFVDKLHELDLYEDFDLICGDIYEQIFNEWAEKNQLTF